MENLLRPWLVGLAICLSSITVFAVENAPREVVYVDNKVGSDDFTGHVPQPGTDKSGPFATIMQAVRKCGVGAKIEIANTGIDYRETVQIEGYKKGRADLPLAIDGHGAYVNGLVVVPAARWTHYKDDIYYFRNESVDEKGAPTSGKMPKSNWLLFMKHQGWFNEPKAPRIFFLNGKEAPNALKLEEIAPGGFFYDSQSEILQPPAEKKRTVFFRLPEKTKLEDCRPEMPLHDGIYVSDDYVTVSNIGSRYSRDDGFAGFWGHGVVLRNIHACFNCDQGISFHGSSSTLIDGALVERNGGCGIVDVMQCTTIYRNVTVRDNYPGGVLLQGFAHAMFNSRVLNNHNGQVTIGKNSSGYLNNCLIVGGQGPKDGGTAVSLGAGRLNRCTILNSRTGIYFEGNGTVENSIIAQCQTPFAMPKEALPKAFSKTIVQPGEILIGKDRFDAATWGEFATTFPGVILDTPALEAPLFGLPKASPHFKAGSDGKPPGAQLPPFAEWSGAE